MAIKTVKKALPWGGSPLCKDMNFPPHQSHGMNRLPLTHEPFFGTPPPPAPSIPLSPISTHVAQAKDNMDIQESSHVQNTFEHVQIPDCFLNICGHREKILQTFLLGARFLILFYKSHQTVKGLYRYNFEL
jgi:hypothetical protein